MALQTFSDFQKSLALAGTRSVGLGLREEDEERRQSIGQQRKDALPKPPKPAKAPRQSLESQADERSILRQTGDAALDTVGAIGNLLDVPGSVARDLLTFLPGGPAPQNPFDQLLPQNWTKSRGRITGQEFLKEYGFDPDSKLAGFGAGLAFEVATDPLSYLSGGMTAALKGGGKGAIASRSLKKAGLLDNVDLYAKAGEMGKRQTMLKSSAKDVLESDLLKKSGPDTVQRASNEFERAIRSDKAFKQAAEGLSEAQQKKLVDEIRNATLAEGSLRFGAFGKGINFGGSSIAKKTDKALSSLRYSKPVVAAASRLSKTNEKLTTAESQKAMRKYLAEQQGAFVSARERMYENLRVLDPVLNDFGDLKGDALTGKRNEVGFQITRFLEDINRERRVDVAADGTETIATKFGASRNELFEESLDDYKENFLSQLRDQVKSDKELDRFVDEDVYNRVESIIESGVADDIKDSLDELIVQAKGFQDIEQLEDVFATYLPRVRQTSRGILSGSGSKRKAFDPENPFRVKRADELRNLPGGTAAIQRMSVDPRFAGVYSKKVKNGVKEDRVARDALFQKFVKEYGDEIGNHSKVEDLFDSITKRNIVDVQRGVPMFGINPAESSMRALEQAYKAKAQAQMYRDVIRDTMYVQSLPGGRFASDARTTFGASETTDAGISLSQSLARQVSETLGRTEEEVSRRLAIGTPPQGQAGRSGGGGQPSGGGGQPSRGGGQPSGGGGQPSGGQPSGGGAVGKAGDELSDSVFNLYTVPDTEYDGFFRTEDGSPAAKVVVDGEEYDVVMYSPSKRKVSIQDEDGVLEDIDLPETVGSQSASPQTPDPSGVASELADTAETVEEFADSITEGMKGNTLDGIVDDLAKLTDEDIDRLSESYSVGQIRELRNASGLKEQASGGRARKEILQKIVNAAKERSGAGVAEESLSTQERLASRAVNGTSELLLKDGFFYGQYPDDAGAFIVKIPEDAPDFGVLVEASRQAGKGSEQLSGRLKATVERILGAAGTASARVELDLEVAEGLHRFKDSSARTIGVEPEFVENIRRYHGDDVSFTVASAKLGNRGKPQLIAHRGKTLGPDNYLGHSEARELVSPVQGKKLQSALDKSNVPFPRKQIPKEELDSQTEHLMQRHIQSLSKDDKEYLLGHRGKKGSDYSLLEKGIARLLNAGDWSDLNSTGINPERIKSLQQSGVVDLAHDFMGNTYYAISNRKLPKWLGKNLTDDEIRALPLPPNFKADPRFYGDTQKIADFEEITGIIDNIPRDVRLATRAERMPVSRLLSASADVREVVLTNLFKRDFELFNSFYGKMLQGKPADTRSLIESMDRVRSSNPGADALKEVADKVKSQSPNRDRLISTMADVIGHEKAATALAVSDATAKAWARSTGSHPDEYYAGIRKVVTSDGLVGDARGSIAFDADANTAVLTLVRGKANASTIIHELAHYAERHLSAIDPELQRLANKAVNATSNDWTTAQKEMFARGLERYIAEGVSPTEELASVYEKIRQWIIDLYRGLPETEINDDLRKVYARMQGADPKDFGGDTSFDFDPIVDGGSGAGDSGIRFEPLSNADARDGDQLGLIDELGERSQRSSGIKGSAKATEVKLFGTEGDPDQRLFFDDSGVTPDDLVGDKSFDSAANEAVPAPPRRKRRSVVSTENKEAIADALGVSLRTLTKKGNWHVKKKRGSRNEILQDRVEKSLEEARELMNESEDQQFVSALAETFTDEGFRQKLNEIIHKSHKYEDELGDFTTSDGRGFKGLDELAQELNSLRPGAFEGMGDSELFSAILALGYKYSHKNGHYYLNRDKFMASSELDLYDQRVIKQAKEMGLLDKDYIFGVERKIEPSDSDELFQRPLPQEASDTVEVGDAIKGRSIASVEVGTDYNVGSNLESIPAETRKLLGDEERARQYALAVSKEESVRTQFDHWIITKGEGVHSLGFQNWLKSDMSKEFGDFQAIGDTKNSDWIAVNGIPSDDMVRRAVAKNKHVDKKTGVDRIGSFKDRAGELRYLRIDIPAYTDTGQYVVTSHRKLSNSGIPTDPDGYSGYARLGGTVKLTQNEGYATAIARGERKKTPLATVTGVIYDGADYDIIPDDIDNWIPVGYNPKKAPFFFDKRNGEEIVEGVDAISVGNTVYIKKVTQRGSRKANLDPAGQWQYKKFESNYFKNWFGDSVLASPDKKGERMIPTILYHSPGEDSSMLRFSESGDLGPGFYMTTNADEAEASAAIYAKVENPFVVKSDPKELDDWFQNYKQETGRDFESKTEGLRAAGYDGIIFERPARAYDEASGQMMDTGKMQTQVVVFDRSQGKSVSNQGTFSSSPDILYQSRRSQIEEVVKNADGDPSVRVTMPQRDFATASTKTYIEALRKSDGEQFAEALGRIYSDQLKNTSPELDARARLLYGAKDGDWSTPVTVDGATKTAREWISEDFAKYASGKIKPPIGLGGYFDGLLSMAHSLVTRNPEAARTYKTRKFFGDLMNQPFGVDDVRLSDINLKLKHRGEVATARLDAMLTAEETVQANRNVLRERFEYRKSQADTLIQRKLDRLEDPEVAADASLVRRYQREINDLETLKEMDVEQWMDEYDQMVGTVNDAGRTPSSHLGVRFAVSPQSRLRQVKVPRWVSDDLYKMEEGISYLEDDFNIGPFLKWFDGYSALFKSGVTSLHPGFHVRNFFSGFVQNILNDVNDPRYSSVDPRRFTAMYSDGRQMMYRKEVKEANKIEGLQGMSDLEATEQLAKELLAHGVIEQPGSYRDMPGIASSPVSAQLLGPQPGVNVGGSVLGKEQSENVLDFVRSRSPFGPPPVSEAAKKGMKKRKVALNAVGDSFRKVSEASRAIGDVVEFQHRVGGFIALRRQGYSASEAAKRINLLHVDYANLSTFEKEYLRRAIPFYSFSRGMAKYLANELTTNPAGPVGITIRAQNKARDRDAATPTYVSKGLSIPIGMNPDGTRHFITGLGLMHEQPVQQLAPVFGFDPAKTFFAGISNMNPILKAPLELAFDESSFQEGVSGGVDLDDARPPVGQMITNLLDREDEQPVRLGKAFEVVAGSSPLSRYIKTISQMSDDRKGIGGRFIAPMTGFRITSVSPERQDAVLRERAEEYLQGIGGRQFVKRYIPDDVYERMSDEDKAIADKYMALIEVLGKRGKERRANKKLLEQETEKGLVDGERN